MYKHIVTEKDANVSSLFTVINVFVRVYVLCAHPYADFSGGFKDLQDRFQNFQIGLNTILTYHKYCLLEEILVTVIIPFVHTGYKQLWSSPED